MSLDLFTNEVESLKKQYLKKELKSLLKSVQQFLQTIDFQLFLSIEYVGK